MRAARSLSRLLLLSVLIRFTQVGAESRGVEEPACLGQCSGQQHGTGMKPSGAKVGGLHPQETLSRGSKCKCYCGVEPCGTTSERWEPRPQAPAPDLVTIQALAANLQGILDNAETKRLISYSAKLTSQLKKLEKDTVKANQIKPSLPNGDTSKDAAHKQQYYPQPPVGTMPTLRPRVSTDRPVVSTLKAVVRGPLNNNGNMIQEDSCNGTPVMIGDPTIHSSYGRAQGAWMKDPIINQERVYVANYFFGTTLIEFRSLELFKLGRWINSYKLPYSWMGTGHAVYNGSFYYNKAYTRSIIRYDLGKRAAASWGWLDDLAVGSTTLAGWKGYSEVDFTADEGGLWVTYFSNDFGYLPEEVLVLSRLDPIDLTMRKETTWKTQIQRASYGNSFLTCGVLYVMNLQRHREGTITYAFDTHTGFESNPGLRIQSEYSLLTQVDYNPADKLLYAWDNGYQVTYNVRFAY
ncbi:olfactomedin-like protein 2A isoform X3 [Pristis pectinata]|uniref:olfactomedin-like protein 2A isoform X3 n=1 Tax=Pristis pectinata TaxID=685728 RepID=UPI00223CB165|nr:olfactomedin-like protein 2A isoform X3 [Pristis pectinata]